MELTASGSADALAQPRRLTARIDAPAVAAWTLAFTVVAYLALSNGGYDTIVRSQVGIAVWWIVLLGALTGVLPMRFGVAGWVAIGLLGGFAVWTGVAATWSESAERSVIELGRVATYLGVLVLALCLQGRAAARHTINGLACAIGFVTVLAVMSRLHPQWFPVNDQLEFFGDSAGRKLSYPLNYWNALAALAAMGVPLLLGVALGARTLAGQAIAAATMPLSVLCIYLTVSRGGILALAAGTVAFVLFVPRRLPALGTLLVAGVGSAILVSAASQRDALQDGLPNAMAIDQGTQLIWLIAIVCGGVALLQLAISLAARHLQRPAFLAPGRRAMFLGAAALIAVACAIGVAAGGPGWAQGQWKEFTAPVLTTQQGGQDDVFSRLAGVNGNGRYQFWEAARDANAAHSLRGIGPGAFEFWWARHATTPGFVRDAHSLYFETLAETGIVGFALLIGLMLFVLCTAAVRSLRSLSSLSVWIAAAVGAVAAFLSSVTFEWLWELGAIACAVMLLLAVIVVGRPDNEVDDAQTAPPQRRAPRIAAALLAAGAIGAVAVPMAGALATRDSRSAAANGRLLDALDATGTAARVQPYAGGPRLQRALVAEQAGALSAAAGAAAAAATDEPTNWRTWYVLSRLEARRGHGAKALAAWRKAKLLNPLSPLLAAR